MSRTPTKVMDKRIETVFYARCPRVQVGILDIGKIFKVGYAAIREGADDQVIGDRLVAFIATIRRN